MKTRSDSPMWRNALRLAGWMLAAALLAGCTTAGYKKSESASWSAQLAGTDVQAENRHLDATITDLTDLTSRPSSTNAQPQFLRFSAALDRLTVSAKQADRQVNRMWAKRTAYFKTWDQEIPTIRDNELRQSSQARRQEVATEFDNVNREYDQAQGELQSLIIYLQDIRKVLSTDLTRNGLAAVQPSVNNATDRARKLDTTLAQVASDLDALGTRMSSFGMEDGK